MQVPWNKPQPAAKGKSARIILLILPHISACNRTITAATGKARDYVLQWLNFIFPWITVQLPGRESPPYLKK